MELSRPTIFCTVLTLIAIIFLLMLAQGSAPKATAAEGAAAQSIKARDAEQTTPATERALQRFAQQTIRREAAQRASHGQSDAPSPPVLSAAEMARHAWLHVKQQVTTVLLTPSVAKFDRDSVRYVSKGDTSWHISGTVDSQNAFGAMLRQTWLATVHYRCTPDKTMVYEDQCWYVESLRLGNQTFTRPPLPDPRKTAIIDAQQRLTTLGYKTGGADGIVGPATQAALQAFLADQKLPPVTGDLTTALLDAVPAMQQNTQKRSTP